MRRLGLCAWFLAVVSGASAAFAELPAGTGGVALRFSAPLECPDDLLLAAAIEGFLDQRLSEARAQSLSIEARIQGDAARGYSAKVVFVSSQGSADRYLEHPDCDKLTEAVGLVSAIAIDPERVRAKQERRDGADEQTAVPPARQSSLTPQAAAPAKQGVRAPAPAADRVGPSREHTALRAAVSLTGQTVSGLLPGATPGVGAELSLRLSQFEVGLGARSWASRSAPVPGGDGASIALSLTTVGLRPCWVPEWGAWSVLGCARADWGRMSGWGEGVDDNRTRHAQLLSLGGSLALARRIGRLEPFGGLELFAPVLRPRFGVLQEGRELEAFQPRAWGAGAFLGLGYVL